MKHRIPQWAKNGSLVYQRFQRRSLGKVISMLPFPYGTLTEKKDIHFYRASKLQSSDKKNRFTAKTTDTEITFLNTCIRRRNI